MQNIVALLTIPAAKAKPKEPETVFERSQQIYNTLNPYDAAREQLGLYGLSTVERTNYINSLYVKPGAADSLSKKAQKELWKQANEAGIAPRRFDAKPDPGQWGKDKNGRNIGDYSLEDHSERQAKSFKLVALETQSSSFRARRSRVHQGFRDGQTGQRFTLEEGAVEVEKARRAEMADLRRDLYGERGNPYAMDPDWDDVVPIPQMEPEGALAAISYPEDYAECRSHPQSLLEKEHANTDTTQQCHTCAQSWQQRNILLAVSS